MRRSSHAPSIRPVPAVAPRAHLASRRCRASARSRCRSRSPACSRWARSRRGSTVKRRAALPGVPARQPLELRVDGLPVASDSDRLVRSIGLDRPDAPRLRLRAATRVARSASRTRPCRAASDRCACRSTTRTSPTAAATRSRAARRSRAGRNAGRRPPRDRGGPRPLPPVRAVRRLSAWPAAARWRAGSGAVWSLRSNRLRPRGWTSADAAGLPILPGPRPLRGGAPRRDRPRAALHRAAHAARLRVPGAPLRLELRRPGPAADGAARAAARELRHVGLPAPGARRAARR